MLPQEIGANIHQFYRIECTSAQVRRRRSVGRLSFEAIHHLIIGKAGHIENTVHPHWVPGQSRIKAVKNALSRHKRLTRTAFLCRAAKQLDNTR